ncbi:MAG: hypothetical protein HRT57_03440 [Crocinitomicaceae bacterium]|nr:hypothetical protein [Crocinitomicaceae bacterium]
MFKALSLIAILFLANSSFSQEGDDSQLSMIKMMAEYMDDAWDMKPDAGTGNLRVLVTKDGVPMAGKLGIHGEFSFRAESTIGTIHLTYFDPNLNGKWVMEGMKAGDYKITIKGKTDYPNFVFESATYTITDGATPILELKF